MTPLYLRGQVEAAQLLIEKGYDAIKIGGGQNCLQNVKAIREAVGDEVSNANNQLSALLCCCASRRQIDLINLINPINLINL
eukprot:SAG31_NODE_30423_length_381_cov_1.042553_1_plen_81_part_01